MRSAPLLLAALLLVAGAWADSKVPGESPATAPGIALHLEIRGAIGPATKDYVLRGLERAHDVGARLVILEMDTPGGLDAAMRDIIKAILASDVPVATFVAPKGSRAASAGTYILYASHIAAMSPATNLGAATPVQIGGGNEPDQPTGDEPDKPRKKEAQSPASSSPMERKVVNDAVAYIRGLANLRGRNADWAEKAVREAVSLTAEQAVAQKVVDLEVPDVTALLAAADGRSVRVEDHEVRLATRGLAVERYEPDWRTRLLATITDPNIAYFLFLIGIYGLLFEGYNPGAVLPGVVGGICLLLALFAFQVLSVNYAGLALMLLGVTLLVAEAFVPSFGSLGIGGIVAFVIGSVMLLDTDVPGLAISRRVIAGVGFVGSLAILGLMTIVVRNRRRPIVSGREGMIGEIAEAAEDFERHGAVFLHGERWNAQTHRAVRKGESLRVTAIDGLVLHVTPVHRSQ